MGNRMVRSLLLLLQVFSRQGLLSRCLKTNRVNPARGFTLVELLVGLLTSAIFMAATGSIITEVMKQDRRETAKSQTQFELQQALDYIRQDLQEAVFVYTGAEMQARLIGPGLVNGPGTPILAFWKVRRATECTNTAAPPAVCTNDPGAQGIGNLTLTGNMFVLVVYYWQQNAANDPMWPSGQFGPARVARVELDAFPGEQTVVPAGQRGDYRAPITTDFLNWPYTAPFAPPQPALAAFNAAESPARELTAYIDDNQATPVPAQIPCPAGLNPSPNDTGAPSAANGFYAFYACVFPRPTGNNLQTQEVLVFLRGNALARADATANTDDSTYFPVLQAQTFVRGAFQSPPRQ